MQYVKQKQEKKHAYASITNSITKWAAMQMDVATLSKWPTDICTKTDPV